MTSPECDKRFAPVFPGDGSPIIEDFPICEPLSDDLLRQLEEAEQREIDAPHMSRVREFLSSGEFTIRGAQTGRVSR